MTARPAVALTGAASALGAAVADALARGGRDVRAPAGAGLGDLDALAPSVEAIVHAAEDPRPGAPLEALREGNVRPVAELMALLERHPRLRLVHLSTAYVCGDRRGLFTEFDLDCGQGFRSNYERTKCEAERLLRASPARARATVLRPSLVVRPSGEGPPASAADRLLRQLRSGRPLRVAGDALAQLDLVPLDYVAAAIAAVASLPQVAGSTLHLVAGPVGRRGLAELARLAAPGAPPGRVRYLPPVGAPAVRLMGRVFGRGESFPDDETAGATALLHAVTFDDYLARAALAPLGLTCPPPEAYLGDAAPAPRAADAGAAPLPPGGASAPPAGAPGAPDPPPSAQARPTR